jgi:hypothetical protein
MGVKAVFPSRAIALLMGIGFADLVATALLYRLGLIHEMNPLMRPLLEHGEWLFVLVKGATLVATWACMAAYAKTNIRFVRTAALLGSLAYVALWSLWFMVGEAPASI